MTHTDKEIFRAGFYQHFKGGWYLARGLAEVVENQPETDLYLIALHHQMQEEIPVYRVPGEEKFHLVSEDLDSGVDYVVYQALQGKGTFWLRERDDFFCKKERIDGKVVPRFDRYSLIYPADLDLK